MDTLIEQISVISAPDTSRKTHLDHLPTKKMNTDTPTTDQWETYCDECYYHMWRLRRKTERGWHDGVHINTGDEAKGLCDLLNNLEHELTAVTKERDEARGQRDRLAKALRECREDSVELLGERDWWQNETRLDYQKRYRDTSDNIDRADKALQSLTPNKP